VTHADIASSIAAGFLVEDETHPFYRKAADLDDE